MALEANAIHGRLDCAIDELDHEGEQHRGDEQGPLDAAVPQPQGQGYDDQGERKFLTEGRFFPESTPQAANAGTQGAHQPGGAAGLVPINDYAVGFHLKSSCLAARTSSSRRTGMVCGALVTRSGSCSASSWIWVMAATKAYRTSLPPHSVGSISRHSGNRSGK